MTMKFQTGTINTKIEAIRKKQIEIPELRRIVSEVKFTRRAQQHI
jgi:hypothetical protein